jgi:FlaA1/EpsC-like NDP-sugar epimerase
LSTRAEPATAARPGTSGLWTRAIVIGTPDAAAGVIAQSALSSDAPQLVGCLLLGVEDVPVTDIAGVPVLGTAEQLAALHQARPFSAAIVSIPSGMGPAILRVRARLRQLGIPERFVPTLADALGQPSPHAFSALSGGLDLVELIGRTPYGIDRRAVARVIEGKRVLVTGAGGSIGSEICRIAATFKPAQLIMVERAENALFEIDRQIARRFPDLPRKPLLHDVVDAPATRRHLLALRPHAVFHAAAHKHVPLMEDHPAHALSNNLFGTKAIADAAAEAGAERFVMISSDKAVNPSSVMGATKRLAEMYVQWRQARAAEGPAPRTSFTMVRFGNVLGSACSVLPIWTTQLAEGGPVTVTDARMTRYFMTIHEAATLVIQAGAIDAHDTSRGPQPTILVLDMGDPIRILDLAQRFIRLHGFEPGFSSTPGPGPLSATPEHRRMNILFTGARPGEKLHEELAYVAETLLPTPYPGILALAHAANPIQDIHAFLAALEPLRTCEDRDAVVRGIRRMVPEMHAAASNAEHRTNAIPTAIVAAA